MRVTGATPSWDYALQPSHQYGSLAPPTSRRAAARAMWAGTPTSLDIRALRLGRPEFARYDANADARSWTQMKNLLAEVFR